MSRFIKNDPEELAAYVRSLERGLIVFDGRAGVGKTHVARAMRDSVPCGHVDADPFLVRPGRSFAGKLDIGKLREAVDASLALSPLVILSGVCGRYVVEKAELSAASFVWIEPSSVVCLDIDERDFAGDHHADITNHHPLYPEVEKYIATYDARGWPDVIYLNAPDDNELASLAV